MRRCPETGEYVEDWECADCEDEHCKYSNGYVDKDAQARLEKLRSSEFAKAVMERMTAVFPLPEEDITRRLTDMLNLFEQDIHDIIRLVCEDAITSHVTRDVSLRINAMLDDIFTKAVDEQLVTIQKDDKTLVTSIRQQAATRINEWIRQQERGSGKRPADKISKTIESVVADRVEKATNEIAKEAIDKFNKEAMKQMMRGMAKAIGQDAKLARLLTEPL